MSVNESSAFLKNMISHSPFKITKIFTDKGAQFTYELLAQHLKPKNKTHPFDVMCKEYTIEHRLTKFKHPWTNGQVEVTTGSSNTTQQRLIFTKTLMSKSAI
ncbi:hypothetical protein [Holospora obtusa]|uniref:hypothetical protein n=1 Tax=Holospora obtusa TaxID=49893 RepID=UPI001EF9CE1C|nr:hypothetical protein [Holospora obtusa]